MVINNQSVENDFFNWLSGQVSSAQLSNIYTVFADIDSFCLNRKILKKHLFETTDVPTVSKVRDVVDGDQAFGLTYKKQRKVMSQAIHYYLTYIREKCPQIKLNTAEVAAPEQIEKEPLAQNDPLVEFLVNSQIPFVDFRNKKGCLWIVGGGEYKDIIERCKKYGVTFHFKENGSHATDGKPAWWTRDTVVKSCVDASDKIKNNTASQSEKASSEESKNRIQYLNWMKKKGFDNGKTMFYLLALKKIGEYANKIKVIDTNIFLLDTASKFRPVYISLKSNSSFIHWDSRNDGRCMEVVSSYMAYLNDSVAETIVVDKNKSETTVTSQVTPDTELAELLKDDLFVPLREALSREGINSIQGLKEIKLWPFMNRYNLYTIATRQVVLEKVQDLLNSLNKADNKQLYSLVCGEKEYKGVSAAGAYLHFCEDLARRFPLKFRSLIGRQINQNGPIAVEKNAGSSNALRMSCPMAYIPCDLSSSSVIEYSSWLCKKCMGNVPDILIHEPENVAEKLQTNEPKSIYSDSVIPKKNTITYSHEPETSRISKQDQLLIDKMEKITLEADLQGISFDDLKNEMGISMKATRRLAKLAKHLVEIKGMLYHEKAFVDWDEGVQQLETILDKLMQKNCGYVSATQLYKYAHIDMHMFLNDNNMDDERSVYEIAQHLFEQVRYNGKQYVFTGNTHISSLSTDIESNFDIFCKYAEDQGGVFKYNDMVDYLTTIGIKVGNLHAKLRLTSSPDFFYYEEGVLISARSMHIDDEWEKTVGNALNRLFQDVGDHIILREIQPFWFDQLPRLPGGRKWTPLLLQSVLRFWGETFNARTIIAMDTQGIETLHAMLVQNDSPIQNFGDAVVSYLIENNVTKRSFEGEELRMLLVDAKMIHGNELIYNMPKALGGDERFSWDADGNNVTILV